ncbi:MAG TPA: ABC transporter substrate-binding protein [Solirubrobacterales bacterium]
MRPESREKGTRICRWLAGLTAAAALLAGCGGGEEQSTASHQREPSTVAETAKAHDLAEGPDGRTKLKVTLDGEPGAENVGILLAARRGYFRDVGLDVWVGGPLDPSRPVQYVAKGIDDFGVTQQPQILVGNEKGASVVAVGSLVSRPTAALIWLEGSGIGGIADLRGKRIAFQGVPFQKDFLETVLARAGLTLDDVRLRNVGYETVPLLLAGQVDAIFGPSWNLEGVDPELQEAKPVITRVADLGIPAYEESVVMTRTEIVEDHPEVVRRFMSAVTRGTAEAIAEPKAASQAIFIASGGRPDYHPEAREAELKATLPLLSRSARMNPRRAEDLVDWMFEKRMLERRPSLGELFTNAYR